MIKLEIIADNERLDRELERYRPDAKLRRKILKKASNELVKRNKKRITAQKEPDGSSFVPRKTGKKKMFRKIKKQLKRRNLTDDDALINVGNMGIAGIHYRGQITKGSAAKNEKNNGGQNDKNEPARRSQAKALIKAGYKARISGRLKKPSQKWITENLSIGQAGTILVILRGERPETWDIKLPPRKLLGYNADDKNALLKIALTEIENN